MYILSFRNFTKLQFAKTKMGLIAIKYGIRKSINKLVSIK